jgi:hypothetical protein
MLLGLAPTAPFAKELGVCESGAARDVLAGNILLPRFIPGPMVHVPPLYWWLVALCVRILGWGEMAFRLPALLPAALTCAIIYAWAAVRLGREAALWGAVTLFFGHFFLDAARQPRMDALLAMCVTAAIAALEHAITTRQRTWFAMVALAIGLGCLAKGILGIGLPGAVIVLYLFSRRRFAELFRFDLIAAFAIGLAIGLAWYVAGYEIAGHKFLQWQIGMNLWRRFIPAAAGGANYCVHPIWYFAPQVAVGLLPWSLYLPALGVALWSRRRRRLPEPVIYTFCWFAAIFALFSLSRGKCQVYILPAFPPLALLVGWIIAEVCAEPEAVTWESRLFGLGSFVVTLGTLIIVAGALALMVYGAPARLVRLLHPTDRRFLDIFESLAATRHYGVANWLLLSTVGASIVLLGLGRSAPGLQAFGVLLVAAAGARFWFGVMTPALAERETLKLFAQEITDMVPADAHIGHLGIEDCDIYFYSSRPIEPVFHFECGGQFPPYLVIRKQRFDALPTAQRACLTPILSSESVDGHGPRLLVEQSHSPP